MRHDPRHIGVDLRDGQRAQAVHTVGKRSGGSHGHQRVHIGRAVREAGKSADKKFVVDAKDGDGESHLKKGHRRVIIREGGRKRPIPHHVPHGDIHQGNQKDHRRDQAVHETRRLPVDQDLLLRGGDHIPVGSLGTEQGGPVTRRGHRGDHRVRIGVTFHTHGIGQQVHRDVRHAFHTPHGFLDVRGAGSAAHPGDCIVSRPHHFSPKRTR